MKKIVFSILILGILCIGSVNVLADPIAVPGDDIESVGVTITEK